MSTFFVSSGIVVNGQALYAGDNEYVLAGGLTSQVIVFSGANLVISSGGYSLTSTLLGGVETIYGQGGAGFVDVGSGGDLELDTVELFSQGGDADSVTISPGGSATVHNGSLLSEAMVLSGGSLTNSGGETESVILSGGIESVYSDILYEPAVDTGATIFAGGVQKLLSGGVTTGTWIASGGQEIISSGGISYRTNVDNGGTETISAGGIASGTIISAGGSEIVSSGGHAFGTIVYGGTESIASGNVAFGTDVQNGGTENIMAGGTALGTAAQSGGVENVLAGGVASGTIVYSGGTENVAAGGIADGTDIQFGVSEVVSNGATVSGAIIEAGGRLVISAGGNTAATHLKLGGSIDLPNLAYVTGASASATSSSLTVYDGGQTETLQLGNKPPGTSLAVSNDGHGGTEITAVGSLSGTVTVDPEQTSLSPTTSAAIVAAMNQALAAWGEYILSDRPLQIQLNIGATTYPTEVADDVTPLVPLPAGLTVDIGTQQTYPTITQAEAAIAAGYVSSSPDITIVLNPAYLNSIYFGADPNVPSTEIDGVSLFEHEIGHAIGFDGQRQQQSSSFSGAESIFDTWTNASGSSATLVSPAAENPYGGQPVPLTAGASNGSNFYTLANTSGSGLAGDLMAPGISTGTRYQISALDLAAVETAGVPAGLGYYSPNELNQIFVPVQFTTGQAATFTVTQATTPNTDDTISWQMPGITNPTNHEAYHVQREIWLTQSPYDTTPGAANTGFQFFSEIDPSVDPTVNGTGNVQALNKTNITALHPAGGPYYVTYVLAEVDNAGRYVKADTINVGTVTFSASGPTFAELAADSTPSNPDEGTGSDNGATDGEGDGDAAGGDVGGIETGSSPGTSVPAAPTITGTGALSTAHESPIKPFAAAVVTDPNSGASDTLTISLAGSGGTLSGTGLAGGNGTYSLTGSAAAVTTELQALIFTPTAGASGTISTTTFTLTLTDTSSASATDNSTAVTDYDTVQAALPIYRFFDSNLGTHLFTQSLSEANQIIATRPDLTQEINNFGAVSQSSPAAEPVYRFFETGNGTHFFTASHAEFLGLTTPGTSSYRPDFTYEASSTFYVDSVQETGDVAVYRLFDTVHGTQFLTGSQTEYQGLTTPGTSTYRPDLNPEGIAFYAPTGISHT